MVEALGGAVGAASGFECAGNVLAYVGGAGINKTNTMTQYSAVTIELNASAEKSVVFCATEALCERFEWWLYDARRVHECKWRKSPVITTVFDYCLGVLASAYEAGVTARPGRVLLPFEEELIFQDMLTSGLAPKRLLEMMKFFRKSISDNAQFTHDFFFNDEEQRAFELYAKLREYYGAYHACEVERAALELLRTGAIELDVDYVFVDDFQLLSRSAQCFCAALAKTDLVVAYDQNAQVKGVDEYPNYDGPAELLAANPHANVVMLDNKSRNTRTGAKVARALLTDNAFNEKPSALFAESSWSEPMFDNDVNLEICGFDTQEQEIAALCADVKQAHSTDSSVAVALSTKAACKKIAAALADAGFSVGHACQLKIGAYAAGTDPNTPAANSEAVATTLLKLAANPDDRLSLRCICGFGTYMANGALFAELAQAGAGLTIDGVSVEEIGEAGADKAALLEKEAAQVNAALARAKKMAVELAELQGEALVERAFEMASEITEQQALMPNWNKYFSIDSADNADAIVRKIQCASAKSHQIAGDVEVGTFDEIAGRPFANIFVPCMVNGVSPNRAYFDPTSIEIDRRPQLLAREIRRVYACVGGAFERVKFSYFKQATLAQAEAQKLKYYRVRLQNRVRVCEIHPSETLRTLTGVFHHD